MAISSQKRPKLKGRGRGHSFLGLPHYMLKSEEFRSLSGNAIKFLIELAAQYDGKNNGDLSLTRKQALERGWKSGATRDRAELECLEAGFIVRTRQGGLHACNLYAITWRPIDDLGSKIECGPQTVESNLWKKRVAQPQNWATEASL